MAEYKGWRLFDEMPEGYFFAKNAGSPLYGYEFITNGSPLKGGKLALLKVNLALIENATTIEKYPKFEKPAKQEPKPIDPDTPRVINELARKQSILMILNDIMIDLTICEIEGWSKSEYINELKREICKIALREDIVIENSENNAQQSVHLTASGAGGRGKNSLQFSFIADDQSAKHGGR